MQDDNAFQKNVIINNWFGTEGRAEILFKPRSWNELQDFLKKNAQLGQNNRKQISVIGAGSNSLISDDGVSGIIIKLTGSEFGRIRLRGRNIIEAGAGALDTTAAKFSAVHGLSGLEFMATIPGTIGGAVSMNAGSFNQETFDCLIGVQCIDFFGNFVYLKKSQIKHGYRFASISHNLIIISAFFLLSLEESSVKIDRRISKILEKKSISQPLKKKTGGSTFCNALPSGKIRYKAWNLLDKSGCRGMRVGKVYVSMKHCNFLINEGKSAKDIMTIIQKIHKIVLKKFNIDLLLEIKKFGEL